MVTTGQTQSNDAELARTKTLRLVAIAIAIVAFGTLVYGFGMQWKPWYQVPAGIAAYAGVEWQRALGRKIKVLNGAANTK